MFVTVLKPTLLSLNSSVNSLIHLSQTFRLINQMLSSSGALLDSTIIMTIALVHYEPSQGKYNQGFIHFKGIQRIIELRG